MLKKEIRKIFKEKRHELTSDLRNEWSKTICSRLLEIVSLEGKEVSVFLPIERFNEVLTWDILDQNKANFYLPIVQKDQSLVHIKYENRDQLQISEWGIPEPTYGEEVTADVMDIVLVPLLAVDEEGNRVGYGAGFYDRFLKSCKQNCQFIGLGFYPPIQKISDIHEADIPLHAYVHVNGVKKFENQ
ncbi:MAG: 5-formyltetrahydrofolate cyclo-ligase [Flavobacteriales bacterium]|nr:5-formyltetrahydrofolate cyclo-ligase [Flavobacteriales bacterium]